MNAYEVSGMNARELLIRCEREAGWQNYILYGHSFSGNFEYYREFTENKLNGEENEKFLELCNNRIERAKILLRDVAMVVGFVIVAISAIISLSSKVIWQDKKPIDPIIAILLTNEYGIPFRIFFALLIVGVIFGVALLFHYRYNVHVWTAFKEGAILNKAF